MQSVAVGARRRILVPRGHRPAVSQESIILTRMAPAAILRHGNFKVLLGFLDDMDITVAVLTGKIKLDGVDVFPVSGGDVPVAPGAVYGRSLRLSRHVERARANARVTAPATVIPMDRMSKSRTESLLSMAGAAGTAARRPAGRVRVPCSSGRPPARCENEAHDYPDHQSEAT